MSGPPEGPGMLDAKGRWVPAALIKEHDLLRHELVLDIVARARNKAALDAEYERGILDDLAAFVSLGAERYGLKLGGEKGNISLTTFDGRFRVVRQVADFLVFDERLQIAKALVDECIREWVPGSSVEIRALIEHAFQVDKTGRVSTERVLGLRKLEIAHDRWKAAMQAISDSVQIASSRSYVRVYERIDGTDKYRPVGPDVKETP